MCFVLLYARQSPHARKPQQLKVSKVRAFCKLFSGPGRTVFSALTDFAVRHRFVLIIQLQLFAMPVYNGQALLMLFSLMAHQVSTSSDIAGWYGLRGVRNLHNFTLEGGYLYQGKFNSSTSEFQDAKNVPQTTGMRYVFDLCQSFVANSTDTTNLLSYWQETLDTSYPTWIGGGIVADNFEFYTIGSVCIAIL